MASTASLPKILACATALPPHRVDQAEAKRFARRAFAGAFSDLERRLGLFDRTGVISRHTATSPEWLSKPRTFVERNTRYRQVAARLALAASRRCLAKAGILPKRVDHVLLVSTTGLATPSLDAGLAAGLGLRRDVRRTPIWGLGCAGGAAGISRAADLARSEAGGLVLLVSVELCSLNFQHQDRSMTNLVGTGLFGDGAAAVLMSTKGKGPAVLASRSAIWPGTLDVTGWQINDGGLKLLLSKIIPSMVKHHVLPEIRSFLRDAGVPSSRVRQVALHPGGLRILEIYARGLGWSAEALRHSKAVLASCGNMSSASVLFVLERCLADPGNRKGDRILVHAVGPGFSSESAVIGL